VGRARTDVPSSPSPGRARPAVDRSAGRHERRPVGPAHGRAVARPAIALSAVPDLPSSLPTLAALGPASIGCRNAFDTARWTDFRTPFFAEACPLSLRPSERNIPSVVPLVGECVACRPRLGPPAATSPVVCAVMRDVPRSAAAAGINRLELAGLAFATARLSHAPFLWAPPGRARSDLSTRWPASRSATRRRRASALDRRTPPARPAGVSILLPHRARRLGLARDLSSSSRRSRNRATLAMPGRASRSRVTGSLPSSAASRESPRATTVLLSFPSGCSRASDPYLFLKSRTCEPK
jgi:hypothetical protein